MFFFQSKLILKKKKTSSGHFLGFQEINVHSNQSFVSNFTRSLVQGTRLNAISAFLLLLSDLLAEKTMLTIPYLSTSFSSHLWCHSFFYLFTSVCVPAKSTQLFNDYLFFFLLLCFLLSFIFSFVFLSLFILFFFLLLFFDNLFSFIFLFFYFFFSYFFSFFIFIAFFFFSFSLSFS